MQKVKVIYDFQDIHTGAIYVAGSLVDFEEERLAELHQNLPGFVISVDEDEKVRKPSRKKKEVTDELPEAEA